MSTAMVYTPAVTQHAVSATERDWSATQQQQRSTPAKSTATATSISIARAEPVVKRTVTIQDVSFPEPMQGLLIIHSDSEDDDDQTSSSSSSSNGSSHHDPVMLPSECFNQADDNHAAEQVPPVKSKSKALPPVPLYVPDLHGDTASVEQEPQAITPESPFLMIPTQLEPIQESLDSVIEEELPAISRSDKDEDDDPAHDEKTCVDNDDDDDNSYQEYDAMTAKQQQEQQESDASSTHAQKPFEPAPVQIPHTPEEAQPPTIWSVDRSSTSNSGPSSVVTSGRDEQQHNVILRRRASKEELPPAIDTTQLPSNVSLCSRCSSISSAPSSAVSSMLSSHDLLRAAAAQIPRSGSTLSLQSASSARPLSPAWEPHQQPLMLPRDTGAVPLPDAAAVAMHSQPSVPPSPLHKAQSTPHFATTAALLQPVPVKSRLSIASFSLTHNKDAIKTYRRMASKTHDKATQLTYAKYLLDVARLYKSNHVTRERLLSEAGYWIERLAKAGIPEALFIKGKWHLQQPETDACAESYRTKPQPLKAFKCFQAAAHAGWIDAYYELARYQKSRGEYARAVECYRHAASKGHTLATYKMAKILLRGQLQQKRNIKLGIEYLQKAADAPDSDNSSEPAYVLSCVYADELERIGIARESQMSRKNIPLATHYLQKAAQAGLPMAVHRMGQVHEHGLLGFPADPWQGYSCYVRAAEDGHEGAMLDLSRLYAQGIPGYLMPQYEVAFKWCQRAADKGLEQAEYVLGTYYEDGIGTSPNYASALECFTKASTKGYAPAGAKLNHDSTAAATDTITTVDPTSDEASASSQLLSLRVKRQPTAAERPTDDDPAYSAESLYSHGNSASSSTSGSSHNKRLIEPSQANCFIM